MIVVGDCQGQLDAVEKLHERVSMLHPNEQWIFVGDVIDRGPQSAQLIRWIRDNNYETILGNHEDMMIDYVDALQLKGLAYGEDTWIKNGGGATIISYFPEHNGKGRLAVQDVIDRMKPDAEWMKTLPRYIEREGHIITHAPIPGAHAEWRDYVRGNPMAIWNRYYPKPIDHFFQIHGHNGRLKPYKQGEQTFALCIDDSYQGNIACYHTGSKMIYMEPFAKRRSSERRKSERVSVKEAE